MKKILTLFLLGLTHLSFAANLPEPVLDALKQAHIPVASVGVVVQEVRADHAAISMNANVVMNPASTMKLLTTLSALETLGPAYRWKTEVYLDGQLDNGVLQGNLVFKGYGDPKFTVEQFWLWLHELRQRGLREIRGDIVLDHSFFAPQSYDAAEFDNDPTRAYNVGPNALLLNFNALHLHLIPNGKTTIALLEPDLAGYKISNRIVTSAQLPCHAADAYRSRLDGHTIMLEGSMPLACGDADDYFSLLPHDDYFFAVFNALWQELGGTLKGKVRDGVAPMGQIAYATHLSTPLAEVIRDINKFSNNIMARQLFLTLGAQEGQPADTTRSTVVVQQWLAKNQMKFPELVLENGAGLSRKERISPQHLADVLQAATRSLYSAELEASLPILGIDGTVKKRFKDNEIAGHAHLKTGTLDGVKSLAGYVHAQSGKQWIVVFIINHDYAASGQAAQDALIDWLQTTH